MTFRLQWIGLAAWTGAGLFLIWLLFALLGVSIAEAVAELAHAPLWLFAIVISLSFSNKIIGALKWRAATRYLATPVEGLSFLKMVELTSLGALFGQIIPVQLSSLIVRWLLLDRETRAAGYVLRSTLFEQCFDLVLVSCGAIMAVGLFALGLPPTVALPGFFAASFLALVGLRPLFRLFAATSRIVAGISRLRGPAERAADGFSAAAAAPIRVLVIQYAYSFARLIIVALRAVAVLYVFAPQASPWLVAIASPGVGLLTALPITPAGLGVTEWTWSAVLVYGGTPATAASIASLNLRLIAMVALFVIVAALAVILGLLRGVRATANGDA